MMLGARTSAWAKSGGGVVNPYITDGLFAMWDGEWNGGVIGEHISNANQFVDIVNGVVAIPEFDLSFGENYAYAQKFRLASDAEIGAKIVRLKNEGKLSVEMVFKSSTSAINTAVYYCEDLEKNYYDFYEFNNAVNTALQSNKLYGVIDPMFINPSRLQIIGAFSNMTYQFFAVNKIRESTYRYDYKISNKEFGVLVSECSSITKSPVSSYPVDFYLGQGHRQGEKAWTWNSTYNCYTCGELYLYCIRFYERLLSTEEVQFNYLVDSKRFGLPTA